MKRKIFLLSCLANRSLSGQHRGLMYGSVIGNSRDMLEDSVPDLHDPFRTRGKPVSDETSYKGVYYPVPRTFSWYLTWKDSPSSTAVYAGSYIRRGRTGTEQHSLVWGRSGCVER